MSFVQALAMLLGTQDSIVGRWVGERVLDCAIVEHLVQSSGVVDPHSGRVGREDATKSSW